MTDEHVSRAKSFMVSFAKTVSIILNASSHVLPFYEEDASQIEQWLGVRWHINECTLIAGDVIVKSGILNIVIFKTTSWMLQ